MDGYKEQDIEFSNFSLKVENLSFYNYTLYQTERNQKRLSRTNRQNIFSLIKSIVITNYSDIDYKDIKLKLSFSPDGFFTFNDINLSLIEASSTYSIDVIDDFELSLSEKLFNISDKIDGSILFQLLDKDNNLLLEHSSVVNLLPKNETGEVFVSELDSCYVTPDDPYISEILSKANYEFTGYSKEDPNITIEQARVIYDLLLNEQIKYALPPKTFYSIRQKIRTADFIRDYKIGTCLDLAILFASIFEKVKLKPILIMMETHAYVGVFLSDINFDHTTEDNINLILRDQNVLLIECTTITNGTGFEEALEIGKSNLNNMIFEYSLDVYKCRQQGYLPIPTFEKYAKDINITINWVEVYPKSFVTESSDVDFISEETLTKFDEWEKKLLDLSLRNRLINFPIKSNLQIVLPHAQELLDTIDSVTQFSLVTHDNLDIDPFTLPYNLEDEAYKIVKDKKLLTVFQHKAEDIIKTLNVKADDALKETGSNILYLTLGIVKWNHPKNVNKFYYAPLLLFPVKLSSKKSGLYYKLEINEDEMFINHTILEYFSTEFKLSYNNITKAFPTLENGDVDLKTIFDLFRKNFYSQKSWRVYDNLSFLSLFSFANQVMWSDIKEHKEKMLSNKIVRSLFEERKAWTSQDNLVDRNHINEISNDRYARVLPADSSQIKAIINSNLGESFVLDGPPGTGKSQTIANIIANAMYHQKKVLFVAEKRAALEVVKHRLDVLKVYHSEIGDLSLGDFTLELHSNKAVKSSVLKVFEKLLKVNRIDENNDFITKGQHIDDMRLSFNGLQQSLVESRGIYSLTDAIYEIKDYISSNYLLSDNLVEIDKDSFQEIIDGLEKIKVYENELGTYNHNILQAIKISTYNLVDKNNIVDFLDQAIKYSKRIITIKELIREDITNLDEILTYKQYSSLVNTLYYMINNDQINIVQSNKLAELFNVIMDYIELRKNQIKLKAELDVKFSSFYNIDGNYLKKYKSNNWFINLFYKGKIVKEIKPFYNEKQFKNKSIIDDLRKVEQFWLQKTKIQNLEEEYKLSDYIQIEDLDFFETSFKQTYMFYKNYQPLQSIINLNELLVFYQKKKIYKSDIILLNDYLSLLYTLIENHKDKISFDFSETDSDYLIVLNEKCTEIRNRTSHIQLWVEFNQTLNSIMDKGLSQLVTDYRNGIIFEERLIGIFRYNLAKQIIDKSILEDNLIQNFNSFNEEAKIQLYTNLITDYTNLTIQEIMARITQNYPSNVDHYAESNIITKFNKIIQKSGRNTTLRETFSMYNELIMNLTPVIFMSPLTVAQFLDIQKYKFDLVIFDEASQIKTSDAIGSLARGENCIIAGDPKQMPPTSFFEKNLDFSEELNFSLDLESLLDDTLALNLPTIHLNYHYRSRFESLINFSNQKFYNNKLYTFPSPEEQINRIEFKKIDGIYETKKGINQKEAETIISDLVHIIQKNEKKSIGIIAFNQKQQDLIRTLLDQELSKIQQKDKKTYDLLMSRIDDEKEPLFVKNLENVQGDERDYILFSICFGQNSRGKFSMNFGPLSLEKGERRLNVAASRSREKMVIYCSFEPNELRTTNLKNLGAEYLKEFLEYAYSGNLTSTYKDKMALQHHSIAKHIYQDLIDLGYKVDINKGASRFKLDLVIKDPKDENKYILGILLDSHKDFVYVDQYYIQPMILKGLKWNIMRVWSLDYYDEPKKVIKMIDDFIKSNEVFLEEEVISPSTITISSKKDQVYKYFKAYEPYTSVITIDAYSYRLENLVINIIKKEAPITKTLLYKRIREFSNVKKIGSQLEYRIQEIISGNSIYKTSEHDDVYWNHSDDYKNLLNYRIESNRSIKEISLSEIAVCVLDVMSFQKNIDKNELIKIVSSIFGYKNLTESTANYIEYALSIALEKYMDRLSAIKSDIVYINEDKEKLK